MRKTQDLPEFLAPAIQSLAYWIGYSAALFPHYDLNEGAIAWELYKLLRAHRENGEQIFPEIKYSRLTSQTQEDHAQFGETRVDIVVADLDQDLGSEDDVYPLYLLEVKRACAGKQKINEDIQRLHNYLMIAPSDVRAFLIVASPQKAPSRFVQDGQSIKGEQRINMDDQWIYFRVRRTCKATQVFSNRGRGHFCCLIEVFRGSKKFRRNRHMRRKVNMTHE